MRRPTTLLAVLLTVTGCASAPPPKLPSARLQQDWEQTSALERGAAVDAAWWHAFGDPVLDALMGMAEQRNLDLRIAEARIREARALRQGARAERLPQLNGTAGISHGRAVGSDEGRTTGSVGLQASWEADLFGRLRGEARAADAEWVATVAERDSVRLALAAEVAGAYVEYRLYRTQHTIAESNAKAAEETLRIVRARFTQGVASRLDVERALTTRGETRARVAQLSELAEATRHRLVLLLATTPAELAAVLPDTGPLPSANAVGVLLSPTEVIGLRPDVRAAEARLLAAVARREAAEALRYPRLTLSGLLGLQSGTETSAFLSGGSLLWSLGANLLAPILDFGRIRANVDAADARQEQAYLDYELTARTSLQEVQTALILFAQGEVRRTELAAATDSARKAAELARRQYSQGTLSLLEVLDAERTLYALELQAAQATADVSLRLVRLYLAMGLMPPREGTA
ncbi:efflux transporter outer membrane subunit [Pyxidicoccus fallax]|uniref:Efflux transporter outer membrane subunit n=1 Tax=Pyxidicoccus fallax TaxID=394095 RepID=A0A848LCM4_9BACT|nr:efflux transporter outer membrane subunit [Pyxidicoccus fallax]NMO15982.1 efflux transporter outer membrane subunit [Pyxidicoccus fallax]NPC77396.1 efflux transporter outer membrane subunit [Pyxidicoccus fallax]